MTTVQVIRGDITRMQVDAIVNAANSALSDGSGVNGAIQHAGGPDILNECREIIRRQGSCPTGEAVMTTAGKLPAKKVIHTVGPIWSGGHHYEAQLLRNCYINSLQLAMSAGLRSIAFPNISTGIFGYPKNNAASIALHATQEFLQHHPGAFNTIMFVCFDEENYSLYTTLKESVFGKDA